MSISNFRTELNPERMKLDLTHQSKVLCIGSCFAERIGEKLKAGKFTTETNPFGILFNPISNFTILKIALDPNEEPFFKDSLIERDNKHYSLLCHSSFNANNASDLIERFKRISEQVKSLLANADVLILTFGSAFIYNYRQTGLDVGNCHKIPAKEFDKRLLSTDDVAEGFAKLMKTISTLNPNLQVILTVSPVRHLRDGLENNSVSKSILRLSCELLTRQHGNVQYFPSYELMMDDLRDYRFYSDDLLHPTPFAENYIWEKFKSACMPEKTLLLLNEWDKIRKNLAHKPLNPSSDQYREFLTKLLSDLEKQPFDCKEEINSVRAKLELIKAGRFKN